MAIAPESPYAPARRTVRRWFLRGRPELPPIELALPVGERVGAAVEGAVAARLGRRLPPELVRHDPTGGPARGHHHPFYLPEDADGDGRIDHLVMYAPQGFDPCWHDALDWIRPAAAADGPLPAFDLQPDWEGRVEGPERSPAPGSLLGPARFWRSATPWVPNLHVKWWKINSPEAERAELARLLRAELRRRGLDAAALEWLAALPAGERHLTAPDFVTVRPDHPHGVARSRHPGSFWRLAFAWPVPGPLAFGFACHLGLGLFRHDRG
jgi:CRISPR-associated protein Csb2